MAVAVKTHDGHAHPKCLAGRHAAGVRERVKRNVHVVVFGGMFGSVAAHFHAFKVEAETLQAFGDEFAPVFRRKNFVLEYEPTFRHAVENFFPRGKNRVGDFRVIVETAKGDKTVARAGRLVGGFNFGQLRIVTNVRLRQANQLFGEITFVARAVNVRQKIVEAVKPRRIHVTDARNLHGRRTIRRHAKSVARRVTRQVNQNVNFVFANQSRRLKVRQVADVAPNVRRLVKVFGDVVGCRHGRIKVRREKIFVQVAQQVPTPRHDRMPMKVRRQEADADFFVRVSLRRKRRHVRQISFVFGVQRVEVFAGKIFRRVRREKCIADFDAGLLRIVFEPRRQAKLFNGSIDKAQFATNRAEQT